MGGLRRLCKLYGEMQFVETDGKKTTYYWDFVKDKPRIKSEMSHEEWCASEKKKYESIKNNLNLLNLKKNESSQF